jgi:hypothetical protein
MKCYYHRDVDAVGICKSCSRGICGECAAEVGDSLACMVKCVESVAELDRLVARSKASFSNARRTYLITASLMMMLATALFAWGCSIIASGRAGSGFIVFFLSGFLVLFSISYIRAGLALTRDKAKVTT